MSISSFTSGKENSSTKKNFEFLANSFKVFAPSLSISTIFFKVSNSFSLTFKTKKKIETLKKIGIVNLVSSPRSFSFICWLFTQPNLTRSNTGPPKVTLSILKLSLNSCKVNISCPSP